jgi:phage terminase small subunit
MPLKKRKVPKRQVFVAEYLKDFNATQAARRAGYAQDPDVAGATAARLLAQPEVANEVATSLRAVLDRAEFSLERWVTEVWRMALVDPAQFYDDEGNLRPIKEVPIEARRALAGFEELEQYDKEGVSRGVLRKVKFATKALKFLSEVSKAREAVSKVNVNPIRAIAGGSRSLSRSRRR